MVLFVILFWAGVCQSQEKRKLLPEDYKLWHTLKMGVASDDGSWTSYSKLYNDNKDTLFLKNMVTNKEYFFPNGENEKITKKGDMFTFMSMGSLYLLHTKTGKQKKYFNVNSYEVFENCNYLVYQSGSTLIFESFKSGEFMQFEGVKEYSICPNQEKVVVIQKNEIEHLIKFINLKDLTIKEISSIPARFEYQQLVWNATGNTIGYYIFDTDNEIYNIESISFEDSIRRNTLDWSAIGQIYEDVQIIKSKLYVSDKGDKVYFDTQQKNVLNYDNRKVKVWTSTDKEIPPKSNLNYKIWNVWLPLEGRVHEIEQNDLKICALIDKSNKAVLLDNDVYLPLYEYGDRYSDVYLMDFKTGIKGKIIEKQLRVYNHLVTGLNWNYIVYFKNNHWWCYNLTTKEYYCLTENIPTVFNKYKSDRLDSNHAYGFGGWTTTNEIMVYDEYDIWLISLDGKKKEKLTAGRENKVIHRIYTNSNSYLRDEFIGFVTDGYDLKQGLIIHTRNSNRLSEGFGIWFEDEGFKELVHEDFKILYIKDIGGNKGYQYIISRFNTSPQIHYIKPNGTKKLLAQSNEQQNQFYWGKSELIYYQSPEGEVLKGALFSPANYNPEKQYPMIVSIYENQSMMLHEYVAPTMNNFTGFNVTNFTQEGYFVLMPDISYITNRPGKSALNCVLSAVNQVLTLYSIDESKLGLIGHSFGGFETSYIVSQTNTFKTAVVGAGVNDLLSYYLDIDSSDLSNMERFESSQFRNKILFSKLEFQNESPIMNVNSINIPLLLWTGNKDSLVSPSYSIKFYAALWRLQKKSILLIYPDEEHVIVDSINQIDLTNKTMSWFNYYLKGDSKKSWMK